MDRLLTSPHRRWDPLNGEWVLVSPHRSSRPWLGKTEEADTKAKADYDPQCYLCPGNKRVSGEKNPKYNETYVFNNDFQAMSNEAVFEYQIEKEIFKADNALGESRVVCFSPDHSKTIAKMSEIEILDVLECFINQEVELRKKYTWVQIFENRGEIMGCSNPHPHAQIWACNYIPSIVKKELQNQDIWFRENNTSLLMQTVTSELKEQTRLVAKNTYWVIIVPFWAKWPFETMVLPRFEVKNLSDLNLSQKKDLAQILSSLAKKYDAVFECEFPYSMGWHGAPFDNSDYLGTILHAHFYPPLLRSATVKKFMVGFEMLCESQRDITPEAAAKILRSI